MAILQTLFTGLYKLSVILGALAVTTVVVLVSLILAGVIEKPPVLLQYEQSFYDALKGVDKKPDDTDIQPAAGASDEIVTIADPPPVQGVDTLDQPIGGDLKADPNCGDCFDECK